MDNDKANMSSNNAPTTLPRSAYLPINRCNLPAVILGSLTFQQHPTRLTIDGVQELHHDLLCRLDDIRDAGNRAQQFIDYMTVHFLLNAPDEAGLTEGSRINRSKADYLRLVRGWAFDAESRDAAVFKGWVESRFGLIPRFHKEPIHSASDEAYHNYLYAYAEGLYNTNSLEAQLDLLYCYCQYELHRQFPSRQHLILYRGINRISEFETLQQDGPKRLLLLNNINSFSASYERASEFGDHVLKVQVPQVKVIFYDGLLPGVLKGEHEYAVLGGVFEVVKTDLITE